MSKQLVRNFVDYLKTANRSHSTIIAYAKDIEQFLEHASQPIEQLESDHIQEVLTSIQNTYGFTPKTISRKLNSYRMFFRHLQEKGIVTHNPAEKIDHPKFSPKVPRVLTQTEYLALREVARGNIRLYTMIELMLQTGLRISEISRAVRSDLDLDAKVLSIAEYSTNNARKVPLNDKALIVVDEFLRQLPSHFNEAHPLFPTREGKHIIVRNIRSSVDRAMAKANIADACVNDLRNTFIVHQLRSGVPIDYVAQIVGHRSRVTTNKYLSLLGQKYQARGEISVVEL